MAAGVGAKAETRAGGGWGLGHEYREPNPFVSGRLFRTVVVKVSEDGLQLDVVRHSQSAQWAHGRARYCIG